MSECESCNGRGYFYNDMMGSSFSPCSKCKTYEQSEDGINVTKITKVEEFKIKKDINYKDYKITITWPGNNTAEDPINYEVFCPDSDIPVLVQGNHDNNIRVNLKELMTVIDEVEINDKVDKYMEQLSNDKGYEYYD